MLTLCLLTAWNSQFNIKHSCVRHVSHHHEILTSDARTQLADLMDPTVQYRAVVVCCTLTLNAYTLLADSMELEVQYTVIV